jgi:hypothetical protein
MPLCSDRRLKLRNERCQIQAHGPADIPELDSVKPSDTRST